MRKFTIVALVALCAAFQGEVYAAVSETSFAVEFNRNSIDGETLSAIWSAVANETEYSYQEVKNMYYADEMTISHGEAAGSYVVEFVNTEGIGTVLIIDGI